MVRLLFPAFNALLIAAGLFWLMQWLITPVEVQRQPPRHVRAVNLVRVEPEPPKPEPQTQQQAAQSAPSRPSTVNPLPGVPVLPRPEVVPQPRVSTEVSFEMPALDLGLSLDTGAGSGAGDLVGLAALAGAGSGGGGGGKGFSGRKLIPVSTGRPQFPEEAYKRGIEGWVKVVFIVDARGQVSNIRVVDAQPKGVFEAAAVESVKSWQYDQADMRGRTLEVIQKLPFRLRDFEMNWR